MRSNGHRRGADEPGSAGPHTPFHKIIAAGWLVGGLLVRGGNLGRRAVRRLRLLFPRGWGVSGWDAAIVGAHRGCEHQEKECVRVNESARHDAVDQCEHC